MHSKIEAELNVVYQGRKDEYQDAIDTLVEQGRALENKEGNGDVEMGDAGGHDDMEMEKAEGEEAKTSKRRVRIVEYPQNIE
jgi:hypothetical protein